ncbi:hypothetical protein G7Z17_g5677 [Cylindrodendrum hubeiense]|uniref:Stress-response A/B barrel domain-containing protein n=1 Tax=Cylindrodendrum hubeiense TaxID=595255 RepID=A0A9P5HBF3_9HYPO|nr:hypothetical protein G7Z17_g5677 [Cylindrodendrum hubeiense]
MPFFTIIVPNVPAEKKDQFLAAWPTLAADLKSQPGVAGVSAGPVVAEDGAAVTEFKFIQCIAFKTAEDAETFASSEWAQQHKARYEERAGGEPVVGRFEVEDFPADASPKAFTQFSTVVLSDDGQHVQVRTAWSSLVSALGKDTWGGRSIGGGPSVGLGLIGWDSLEEAGAAYQAPEAAHALATYRSLGHTKNLMVQMQ